MKLNVEMFNRAMDALMAKVTIKELVPFQKKIAIDVLTGIVMKMPVLTGFARNNWQLDVGTVPQSVIDKLGGSNEDTISAGLINLSKLRPFQVVFINNNCEYIEALEHGHSSQAPEGFIELTLAEVKAAYKLK